MGACEAGCAPHPDPLPQRGEGETLSLRGAQRRSNPECPVRALEVLDCRAPIKQWALAMTQKRLFAPAPSSGPLDHLLLQGEKEGGSMVNWICGFTGMMKG